MLRHSTDERSISSMRSVSGTPIVQTLWTMRTARRPEVTVHEREGKVLSERGAINVNAKHDRLSNMISVSVQMNIVLITLFDRMPSLSADRRTPRRRLRHQRRPRPRPGLPRPRRLLLLNLNPAHLPRGHQRVPPARRHGRAPPSATARGWREVHGRRLSTPLAVSNL